MHLIPFHPVNHKLVSSPSSSRPVSTHITGSSQTCRALASHSHHTTHPVLDSRHSPKRLLHSPHIIPLPIPLHHLLLSHRHPGPRNAHICHVVNLVLIEDDLLMARMPLRPLRQPPLLHDLCRLVKRHELARHVAVEDREFGARRGAFKDSWERTCECREARGIGEGLEQLFSSGAEFVGRRYSRGVHGGRACGLGVRGRGFGR